MMRRSQIYFVFLTFFSISAFFSNATGSPSSERFYTVQTGTFSMSALSHAIKQFDILSKKIDGKGLADLRIGQVGMFYVVRIGKFDNRESAKKALQVIKPFIDDAYIVSESKTTDISIVKALSQVMPEEYYTIVVGNHDKEDDASKQFNMLAKTLINGDLDHLRIAKRDGHFEVKMGRFGDYSAALQFLKRIEPLVPDAGVVKTLSTGEQIVRLYDGTVEESPMGPDLKQNSGPVAAPSGVEAIAATEKPADSMPAEPDTGTKTAKVEDLFADISGHYYEQRYDKAAELLREGIKRWPDNADLYAWYGATLLNMKSHDQAYEIYQKAVELSPDVPDYHAGAGYSLLNIFMDKARASIDAFNKALELDPDNIDALEGLGIVYVSIDKKDLAAEISNHLRDLDTEASKRLDIMIKRGVDWRK